MSRNLIVSPGIVATSETEHQEGDIRIIRTLTDDGDSILVTLHGDIEGKTAYIVPTEAIKLLLSEERQGE